ncbi:hypothetical protein C5167_023772 [Papaver somniferum]|uniref:Uncharacterized protein n=1 Tax=Papaver somniferum TaxID=3469 RepID=A0A4Y7JPY3_PAPSO|nr:hypothetical protein C5167_023772 [Papaver somniferum]
MNGVAGDGCDKRWNFRWFCNDVAVLQQQEVVVLVVFEFETMVVVDCGLHVCYYIKSLLKGKMKSHEENISEKVENKAKLRYKILMDNLLKAS